MMSVFIKMFQPSATLNSTVILLNVWWALWSNTHFAAWFREIQSKLEWVNYLYSINQHYMFRSSLHQYFILMLRESISTPDNDKQLFIKIPDEIILIMQWKTMNPSAYSSPIYKSSLGNGLAETLHPEWNCHVHSIMIIKLQNTWTLPASSVHAKLLRCTQVRERKSWGSIKVLLPTISSKVTMSDEWNEVTNDKHC